MNTNSKLSEWANIRISYDQGTLMECNRQATPLAQFDTWWKEITASDQPEPNAMVLSTVDADGQPSARTVLLKGMDAAGFRFFTNFSSRKAQAMAANPQVALVFSWLVLQRQVIVLGTAEKLLAEESEFYFHSRPRDSQLAAWASRQSTPIDDRFVLDQRMAELKQRWPEGTEIPYPTFWGGYLVKPDSVEFWQGRPSRLHDRLRFETARSGAALDDAASWRVFRYSP